MSQLALGPCPGDKAARQVKCGPVMEIEMALEKPSLLETISGSLPVVSTATVLATYVGTPLAALLPVLSQSLASERHKKRVEKALEEIELVLSQQEEKLKELSDSQYKLINEVILTILQTTEQEKIEFLKATIRKALNQEQVSTSTVTQISRVLRDITVDELIFLMKYSHFSRIIFSGQPMNDLELLVDVHSKEGVIVSGLISLGLMVPGAATFDDVGRYQFSDLVRSVVEIISP